MDYRSGKKLARDWQLKLTVDKRSGDITFTDHSKSGKQNFGEACEQFIARTRVGENSRDATCTRTGPTSEGCSAARRWLR